MMAGVTVSVLRSVKVSDDGITNRWIIAGTDDAVPADAVDGLEAEGYVSRGKEKVPMASSKLAPPPAEEVKPAALSVGKDKFGRWAVYRDGVRITKSGSEDAARAALQEMAL